MIVGEKWIGMKASINAEDQDADKTTALFVQPRDNREKYKAI